MALHLEVVLEPFPGCAVQRRDPLVIIHVRTRREALAHALEVSVMCGFVDLHAQFILIHTFRNWLSAISQPMVQETERYSPLSRNAANENGIHFVSTRFALQGLPSTRVNLVSRSFITVSMTFWGKSPSNVTSIPSISSL